MNQQRRDALRISTVLGLAVAAGLITPHEARAAEDVHTPGGHVPDDEPPIEPPEGAR